VPFLRFTRDKRGYEQFALVHPTTNRRGKVRTRVLYWYRTPPGIRVGREPFDDSMRRALEAQHPDITFDWRKIVETPIPSAETEKWRERRRAEKAEKAARRAAAASESVGEERDENDVPPDEPAEPIEPTEPVEPDLRAISQLAATVGASAAAESPAELDLQVISELTANIPPDPHRRRRRRRRGRSNHGPSPTTTQPPASAPPPESDDAREDE
jgi:hypothetical protein